MNENIAGAQGDGLPNTKTVLPLEPDILYERNRWTDARIEEYINNPPRYPEDCVITADTCLIGQAIHFKRSDISEDVSRTQALQHEYESRNISFDELMVITIRSLRSRYKGNLEKWLREYVFTEERRDTNATIADVRENECVSCFHLNLIFSDLMHNIGVDAKVIQSVWVETTRQKVLGLYSDLEKVKLKQPSDSGVCVLEGEKSEYHAFTLVKKDGKYWLADAALWIKDDKGEVIEPVVCEVSKETLLDRDIKIPLPNRTYRHYIIPGEDTGLEIA